MADREYGQAPPSGAGYSGSGSGQAQDLNTQLLDDVAFGLPPGISGFPDFAGLELPPMTSGHPGLGGEASFSGVPYNLAGAPRRPLSAHVSAPDWHLRFLPDTRGSLPALL